MTKTKKTKRVIRRVKVQETLARTKRNRNFLVPPGYDIRANRYEPRVFRNGILPSLHLAGVTAYGRGYVSYALPARPAPRRPPVKGGIKRARSPSPGVSVRALTASSSESFSTRTTGRAPARRGSSVNS